LGGWPKRNSRGEGTQGAVHRKIDLLLQGKVGLKKKKKRGAKNISKTGGGRKNMHHEKFKESQGDKERSRGKRLHPHHVYKRGKKTI